MGIPSSLTSVVFVKLVHHREILRIIARAGLGSLPVLHNRGEYHKIYNGRNDDPGKNHDQTLFACAYLNHVSRLLKSSAL